MQTRLIRSQSDKVIGGVGGGLANYFGIDPVLARLGFIVLTFVTGGLGFLLYGALWLILPEANGQSVLDRTLNGARQMGQNMGQSFNTNVQPQQPQYDPNTGQPLVPADHSGRNQKLGYVLLGVGTLMLASFLNIGAPTIAVLSIGAGWYLLRKN